MFVRGARNHDPERTRGTRSDCPRERVMAGTDSADVYGPVALTARGSAHGRERP